MKDLAAQSREFVRGGDRRNEGRSKCTLGASYMKLGRFDKSLELLHEALKIALDVGDRQAEGMVYCNLLGSIQRTKKSV